MEWIKLFTILIHNFNNDALHFHILKRLKIYCIYIFYNKNIQINIQNEEPTCFGKFGYKTCISEDISQYPLRIKYQQ